MQDIARQSQEFEHRIQQNEALQAKMQLDIKQLKAIPEIITVLFLAANPTNTQPLRLDEEARAIQEKIRLSEFRDSVHFESRWATRSGDILQAINETNPTIVHFSGHGTPNGELALLNPDGRTPFLKIRITVLQNSFYPVLSGDCKAFEDITKSIHSYYVT